MHLLVGLAHENTLDSWVLADAEFDLSNYADFRKQLEAQSMVPALRHSGGKASGIRLQLRQIFLTELYGIRSALETAFSAVERKL